MRHQRPAALIAVTAICAANSVGNLAALAVPPIPRPIAYASLVLALVGLFGAFGIWQLRRWGALLSAAILALTALLAIPGVAFAPVPGLRVVAVLTVTLDIAGIVLLCVPASRRVYGSRRPTTPSAESAVPTR
jgi:uncharacterized membrane protein (DUF2068 family)